MGWWAIVLAVAAGLLLVFLAVPAFPLFFAPQEQLVNGSFEEGFDDHGVAHGWYAFDHGGGAGYAWSAESALALLRDGKSGQAVHLVTPADGRSGAGVFQTLSLIPGETYRLSLHAGIVLDAAHADDGGEGFQLQWGIDPTGKADRRAVPEWMDIPMGRPTPRSSPDPLRPYITTFTAPAGDITLFFRIWDRWGIPGRSAAFILDAVSVRDARPIPEAGWAGYQGPGLVLSVPARAEIGGTIPLQVRVQGPHPVRFVRLFVDGEEVAHSDRGAGSTKAEETFLWRAESPGLYRVRAEAVDAAGAVGSASHLLAVGEAGEFVVNGDFARREEGHGAAWGWNVLGRARFAWPAEGTEMGPEILVQAPPAGAPISDGIAGIYQSAAGLRPGATYRFMLSGEVSAEGDSENPADCRAVYALEWGVQSAEPALTTWKYAASSEGSVRVEETITAPGESLIIFIGGMARPRGADLVCTFRFHQVSLRGSR